MTDAAQFSLGGALTGERSIGELSELTNRQLSLFFARTRSGEAELRTPALQMDPSTRTLLQVLDGSLALSQCVATVGQANMSDAMTLFDMGLIRRSGVDVGDLAARSSGIRLALLLDDVLRLPSHDLYSLLTKQAKVRLGLLHGFRMVLALERCANVHEERALALRFIEEVWRARGDQGIWAMTQILTNPQPLLAGK